MSEFIYYYDPIHDHLWPYIPSAYQFWTYGILIVGISIWSAYVFHFSLVRTLYRKMNIADQKLRTLRNLAPFILFEIWAVVFVAVFLTYSFLDQRDAYHAFAVWTMVAGMIETKINSVKVIQHLNSSRYYQLFGALQYLNYIFCIAGLVMIVLVYILPGNDKLLLAKISLQIVVAIVQCAAQWFTFGHTRNLLSSATTASVYTVVQQINASSRFSSVGTVVATIQIFNPDFFFVTIFMVLSTLAAEQYSAIFTDPDSKGSVAQHSQRTAIL